MSYTRPADARSADDTRRVRPYVAGASLFSLATAIGVLAPGAANAQTLEKPLLQQGSSGTDVTAIQQAIGSTADGDFGQKTHDQVVSFQRQNHLLVDGIVGPQTRSALAEQSGQKQPQTQTQTQKKNSGAATQQSKRHSSSSSSSSYTPTSSGGGGGYSIPAYIVQCESRGNYRALNSSGAGGAYQIKPQTWRAYGGKGLPQNAPKAEQDAVAKRIYQAQGTSPWACA